MTLTELRMMLLLVAMLFMTEMNHALVATNPVEPEPDYAAMARLAMMKEHSSWRSLQDDPTTYCSSMMEVTQVTDPLASDFSILYSVVTGYPNNLKRCLIFQPTADIFMNLTFTFISTEENFDWAEIYPIQDYNTTTSTVSGVGPALLRLSGVVLPANETARRVISTPGQTLMVVLRTDGNRNIWTGFKGSMQSMYRDCYNGMQVIKTGRSPTTFSDGYVDQYPSNYAYCYVFFPPVGEYVQLQFTSMDTEENFDWLEVYSITSYDGSKKSYSGKSGVIGRFSGTKIPPNINGQTNQIILMTFRTDATLNLSGFSGKALSTGAYPTNAPTPAPTRSDCESGIQYFNAPIDDVGIAFDDGFDDPYPGDSVFCYVVDYPANFTRLVLNFNFLSVAPTDQVEVFALRAPQDISTFTGELSRVTQDLNDILARRVPGNIAVFTSATQTPISITGGIEQSLVVQLRARVGSAGTRGGFQAMMRARYINTASPTPAPTGKECSNGMTMFPAPADNDELVLTDGYDNGSRYPDNYQICYVVVPRPGTRLAITFDQLDLANDRLDVYPVRWFNVKTKAYRGRGALLARFTGSLNATDEYVTKTDAPIVFSLRTNVGQTATGFLGRIRTTTAQPTAAPTPPPKCSTKMTVIKTSTKPVSFDDGFLSTVPRNAQLCFVLVPMSSAASVAVRFGSLNLGEQDVLDVQTITSYVLKKHTFSGLNVLTSITSDNYKNLIVSGKPGQTLMVALGTGNSGTRGSGFLAQTYAPCDCSMFTSRSTCETSSCSCKWFILSCGENV